MNVADRYHLYVSYACRTYPSAPVYAPVADSVFSLGHSHAYPAQVERIGGYYS